MTPAEIAAAAIEARQHIDPYIRTTPIEPLSAPGSRSRTFAKCEHLQVTGSFKARGALNKMLSLDSADRAAGVATASTGNHGAAVAYGAHHLGIHATVYVPESAPATKLASIAKWGGEVVQVGGDPLEAEKTARRLARESGRVYVSPYNDPRVIAGQGTVAVELSDQIDHVDTLIVAVGGGGLISGVAAVARQRWPEVRIVGCSPEASKVMLESVKAGQQLELESRPTLSDGTAGGVERGSVTFDLCRTLVDEWVSVGEDGIAEALVGFIDEHHQLVEGSAAMALAAWRQLESSNDLGTCVVVTCGSNIDRAVLTNLLSGP